MVVIIAPYTGSEGNLGASKKIRFIISLLSKISDEIVLVNSAHNDQTISKLSEKNINISGVKITEITPSLNKKRSIGKFINLFEVDQIITHLIDKQKPVNLIWFYNAYAFEMRFAFLAHRRIHAPMVLEFEDWHFSRIRKFSLKPTIDFLFWRFVADKFKKVYAINYEVKKKVLPYCKEVELLPGIVTNDLKILSDKSVPFSKKSNFINIGYFGGLNIEKGGDIVLKIANLLPDGYRLHVTGVGELENEFKKYKKGNDKLFYYGIVSDEKLINIIEECDVILNPHTPISNFKNGIFPFKVIEAISSGRLLISTKLEFNGFEEISKGVQFAECKDSSFYELIVMSETIYSKNREFIKKSSQKAFELFGEKKIMESLKQLISYTN